MRHDPGTELRAPPEAEPHPPHPPQPPPQPPPPQLLPHELPQEVPHDAVVDVASARGKSLRVQRKFSLGSAAMPNTATSMTSSVDAPPGRICGARTLSEV